MVPLGSATWKLSALAAGTYDLVARYTCPTVPAGAKLHVSFAGQEFDRVVTPSLVTKDAKTVRVVRLCQITIKQDVLMQPVVITASPSDSQWFLLSQGLIVRGKE